MSYTGQPRASMAVNPSNTNSLLAKFEAMKKTVAANQTTPTKSSTTAARPPGTTATTSYSAAKTTTTTTTPTNQRGNSGIGQSGGIKTSASPVAPVKASQPAKASAPAQSKFSQFNTPDGEDVRAAPLQKPKPDQHRMTMAVEKPDQLQQKLEQMAINEKKSTVTMPSPSVQSNVSSSSSGDFQVGEKWKINYDDLEFDQLVSSGSAGEVFLGYFFGTPVAIKKLFALAADQRHLVAREFAMLQGVNHPNIVQFLGICDHSTGIYLITEYVEHGDLFDLLVFGEQDIGWRAKVRISAQVAAAVFYLHSRGIIHRDLKSQNVLIGENYKVKLCDLGLATQVENRKRMTVCGTDEWMAPEIVLEETYDLKVDVFSFGVVITEMVTNQPPKKRDFANKLAFDEQAFRDSAPSDCPREFIQIAIDCCRFRPQDRPSFREIVPRLKKLSDSLE